ncbi:MAG: polyprenyl synthetase family protein [Nitrososphaerota archaeon]|nr:polyprenyl synthetase family protein [Aigarchaeota archaeon]MDW8076397.1 polyprenyl synthetase family protein [Nitrososphaerota archaeon]
MTSLIWADLLEYVEAARAEIDKKLLEKINNRSDKVIIKNTLSGGKRLRPVLLLLVYDALGGKDRDAALDVACALELAHNASLIHDDIIDGDIERRGKPALWRQIGIAKAIIQGHRIINLAFQTVLDKGVELAKIFLKAWNDASAGVLEEIFSREPFSKKLYIKIVKEKTASLFAAAAESAAVLARSDEKVRESVREYGEIVGIAYQLADDYVEIIKGRRHLNLPIFMLRRFEETIKQIYVATKTGKLRAILPKTFLNLKEDGIFLKEIEDYIMKAREIVSNLPIPDSRYKVMLTEFPKYCVDSMLREIR